MEGSPEANIPAVGIPAVGSFEVGSFVVGIPGGVSTLRMGRVVWIVIGIHLIQQESFFSLLFFGRVWADD